MGECTLGASGLKKKKITLQSAYDGRKTPPLSPLFYQMLHNSGTLYEPGDPSARHSMFRYLYFLWSEV